MIDSDLDRQPRRVRGQEDCAAGPGARQVQTADVKDEGRARQKCCEAEGPEGFEAEETV